MNKVLSMPISATLSLTPKCNLNCRHCFAAEKMTKQTYVMDLDDWKAVIDQLSEGKVFNVLFSGGEPLLFEGFIELCEYTIAKHINCALNTNGTFVTPKLARWMRTLPFRGRVSVSLDGAKKSTHEYMRGCNSYDLALNGIKNLVNEGVPTQIFFVVTNHNWTEIKEIVYLAKQLGCFQVYINEVYPVGNGETNSEDLVLTYENYIKALDLCAELVDEGYGDYISGTFIIKMDLYKKMRERKRNNEVPKFSRVNGCGNGTKSLVINFDGTVSPCEMLLNVSCGNVLTSKLYDIWHQSTDLNAFRKIIGVKVESFEGCKDCLIKDVCDGGCRAIPYSNGNILGCSVCQWHDIGGV